MWGPFAWGKELLSALQEERDMKKNEIVIIKEPIKSDNRLAFPVIMNRESVQGWSIFFTTTARTDIPIFPKTSL